METLLTYKDNKVSISPNKPFIIIGERINPTRRKKLAEMMSKGDFSLVREEARRQVEAGAMVLDINAGIPGGDEPGLLCEAVKTVMLEVEVPVCIDTANPEALEAALKVYPGKALINSTTAEESMMKKVFPLARDYGAAVIGLITDETGVPTTPEARLQTAKRLIDRAGDFNIPPQDIVIDCLAMTVGADHRAGRVTLDTLQLVREELGVNLSLGASNVSFGLPDRKSLNVAYLTLAIGRGLTTAITDATIHEISVAVKACNLFMGHDEYAMRWIKDFRQRVKS